MLSDSFKQMLRRSTLKELKRFLSASKDGSDEFRLVIREEIGRRDG